MLKYIGAAYLLYLAWKMLGSFNIVSTVEKSSPLKYYEAILFQFVNPKAWIICITAASLFYPEKNINLTENTYSKNEIPLFVSLIDNIKHYVPAISNIIFSRTVFIPPR